MDCLAPINSLHSSFGLIVAGSIRCVGSWGQQDRPRSKGVSFCLYTYKKIMWLIEKWWRRVGKTLQSHVTSAESSGVEGGDKGGEQDFHNRYSTRRFRGRRGDRRDYLCFRTYFWLLFFVSSMITTANGETYKHKQDGACTCTWLV